MITSAVSQFVVEPSTQSLYVTVYVPGGVLAGTDTSPTSLIVTPVSPPSTVTEIDVPDPSAGGGLLFSSSLAKTLPAIPPAVPGTTVAERSSSMAFKTTGQLTAFKMKSSQSTISVYG